MGLCVAKSGWFSETNGRVVIESADYELSIRLMDEFRGRA